MRFAYHIERFVIQCPDCGAIIDNKETRTLRNDLKQEQTAFLEWPCAAADAIPTAKSPGSNLTKTNLQHSKHDEPKGRSRATTRHSADHVAVRIKSGR